MVIWGSAYTFVVRNACFADINHSGSINIDDLVMVITSYGPCPLPPTACPTDIVSPPCGNGVVDIDDLVAVLTGWGACPTCLEDGRGEGEGGESAMMSGGEEDSADIDWDYFFNCFTTGTPQEQADCLNQLEELLQP